MKIDPSLVELEKKYLGTTTLDKPGVKISNFDPNRLFDEIARYENVSMTNELYMRMENIIQNKLMEKDRVTVALMLANKELERKKLEEINQLQAQRLEELK